MLTMEIIMDPTTCYRDLLAALNAGETDEAFELAENLKTWLDRGGFYPEGYLVDDVNRSIAKALNQSGRVGD